VKLPIPTYNAPVTLTFALLAFALRLIDGPFQGQISMAWFAVPPHFAWNDPVHYVNLVTHVLGHRDWVHLTGNLSVFLLLGPILEEKYGSVKLLQMLFITALATGLVNAAIFPSGLMGASGLVFMLILLSSFVGHKRGEIPMTFILVLVLYLAKEIAGMFHSDDIAQSAHLLGGLIGSMFGFLWGGKGGKAARASSLAARVRA